MVEDRDTVELADLPCFGQPATLVWRKARWECPDGCGSFTEQAPQIAASRLKVVGSPEDYSSWCSVACRALSPRQFIGGSMPAGTGAFVVF